MEEDAYLQLNQGDDVAGQAFLVVGVCHANRVRQLQSVGEFQFKMFSQ
jgi:hypothetical protein